MLTDTKKLMNIPKLECYNYLIDEAMEENGYSVVISTGLGDKIVKIFMDEKSYKSYFYWKERWTTSLLSSIISNYDIKEKKISVNHAVNQRPFKDVGANILDSIMKHQHRIKKMEYYKKQQRVQDLFDKLSPYPEDYDEWIADRVFSQSYYFLYKRKGKNTSGYCTHCQSEFDVSSPVKHKKDMVECPLCHFKLTALSEGIYNRSIIDDRKYYSLFDNIDGQIIIRFFSAHKKEKERKAEIKTTELSRHIINKRGTRKGFMFYTKSSPNGYSYGKAWHQFNGAPYQSCFLYDKGLNVNLKGSGLEYFNIEYYAKTRDEFNIFALASAFIRYPLVENLIKQGFDCLADNFVNSLDMHLESIADGVFDLKQTVLTKVFKLSKDQLSYIKRVDPDLSLMRLFKFSVDYSNFQMSKSGDLQVIKTKKITYDQLELIRMDKGSFQLFYYQYDTFEKLRAFTTFTKMVRYRKKVDPHNTYIHFYDDYYDYLEACEDLGFNMKKKSILFPRHFKKSHDKATSLVEVSNDELTIKKLKFLYDNLHELYEAYTNDLVFILPKTVEDFIEESKQLDHCVKNYVKDVVKQETTIIFVRSKIEPETPLYTMECKNGKIKQLRSKGNKKVPEKVKIQCNRWLNNIKKQNPYAFTRISRIS